jgi:hypothetical protein
MISTPDPKTPRRRRTRSQPLVRLGSMAPTIRHSPPDVHSLAAAAEAIELADAYGVADGNPLAESQRETLRLACAERADGSWSATRVGDFGPRQGTGKNDKIAARELAGLILFGEKLIIHTAHEFPTANESFLRLVAVFEAWDDLRRKVARIRYANGEQGIELLGKYGGGRLKYRARTGGSGRGFAKADLVVYDEAQHLAREHVAASGPAKLANPNSQTWYAGSGGLSTSAVAWAIRRAALLGTGGRLAYTEMTGEKLTVVDGEIDSVRPDPLDRDVWYACINGLGRWVTEEAVEALFDELGPELFLRELLCVWDPDPTAGGRGVFPAGKWSLVCDSKHAVDESYALVYGIEANPERTSAAIVVSDGYTIEQLEQRADTGWLAGRVIEIVEQRPGKVAVDPAGPAGSVIDELERQGVEVVTVTGRDMQHACGEFYDAVGDSTEAEQFVAVRADYRLDGAVTSAVKKTAGDAWTWDRKLSTGDVSPLIAATIAWFAALAEPDPVDPASNIH